MYVRVSVELLRCGVEVPVKTMMRKLLLLIASALLLIFVYMGKLEVM